MPNLFELDEPYWFIRKKPNTETRGNTYIFTMVSREPRQLVGFEVSMENSAKIVQNIVGNAPESNFYCSDGYVVYPGKHICNIHGKSDTFTVEGANSDLRHYIPLLARRDHCFPRLLETLKAVVSVFANAYNRFHMAIFKFRLLNPKREFSLGLVDFL